MNIALVDDEIIHLNALRGALREALDGLGLEAELDSFLAPDDLLAEFEEGKYDIIILDIYMKEDNGIDAARRIREIDRGVALAFCTSSNEFASQSYEVDARYYLNKPISGEKVSAMLSRLNLSAIERNRTVRLPDGFRVPLRHILYTEYSNHSVCFHIRGQKPHTVYAGHGDIEKLLLPHKGFFTVNKGCIVNFAQVRRIASNEFLMQNGETLPVARRRFKEIEAAYTEYRFERMDEEDI